MSLPVIAVYIIAQFVGAFVGAVLVWLSFKRHFDEQCEPAFKLGVFSTGPEIRSYGAPGAAPTVLAEARHRGDMPVTNITFSREG